MKKYLIFIFMAIALAATASCGKEKKDPGKEPVPTDGIDAEKVAAFILLQNEGSPWSLKPMVKMSMPSR